MTSFSEWTLDFNIKDWKLVLIAICACVSKWLVSLCGAASCWSGVKSDYVLVYIRYPVCKRPTRTSLKEVTDTDVRSEEEKKTH